MGIRFSALQGPATAGQVAGTSPDGAPLSRAEMPSPRPVSWLILIRPHDDQDRLAAVLGAAQGFEADERRRSLAVVVADVQGEQHDAPAALPGDGIAQHPD